MLLFALAGPFLAGHSPDALSDSQFQPPTAQHWLGTDVHGRDLLARMLYGTRISLIVGVVGAGVSLVLGVLWGTLAGYRGGNWDSILMRTVDVLYSMPSIVFVIVLIATLESSFKQWLMGVSPALGGAARMIFLFAGLGAVSWLTMARIVRGQVLSLRARGFVEAARSMGGSHTHVIRRHILPNIRGVVIVYAALTIPAVILSESFLSYLGLGIQPPQASLGSLMADGAGQINPIHVYWWLIVFPGAALTSVLLALCFVGDGLRDAWDARQ
jgi:peptide/nickel transport system permease protein/oligopeptide transport system permease protein